MSIARYLIIQFFVMGAVCIFEPQIIAAGMSGAFPLLFVSQMIFSGLAYVSTRQHTEQCRATAGISPEQSDTGAEVARYVLVIIAAAVIGSALTVARYPNDPDIGLIAAMSGATILGAFIGLWIRKMEFAMQRATLAELNRSTDKSKAGGETVKA